jgi:hypothetical protein
LDGSRLAAAAVYPASRLARLEEAAAVLVASLIAFDAL